MKPPYSAAVLAALLPLLPLLGCASHPLGEPAPGQNSPLLERLESLYAQNGVASPGPSGPAAGPDAMPAMTGEVVLRDALARALVKSPQLQAYALEVRAAEARVLQAGLWPNPELEAEVENIAGSGRFSGVDSAETTVALAQVFPLGGDI